MIMPIDSIAVNVGTRKIRSNWSIELEQDLLRMHGIDTDAALAAALSAAQAVIDAKRNQVLHDTNDEAGIGSVIDVL